MKAILFKQEMFLSVVNGSKSQTRRIIRPVKVKGETIYLQNGELIGKGITGCTTFYVGDRIFSTYPRYNVGEVVYLKEPYMTFNIGHIAYKYDNPGETIMLPSGRIVPVKGCPWNNKLFMPQKYARYFIEITRVRVERLMDITEVEAIAEGVTTLDKRMLMPEFHDENGKWIMENGRPKLGLTPRQQFERLWDDINVKWNRKHDDYRGYLFQDNPYVWIYEFKLIK